MKIFIRGLDYAKCATQAEKIKAIETMLKAAGYDEIVNRVEMLKKNCSEHQIRYEMETSDAWYNYETGEIQIFDDFLKF